jgi:hypothetical protein
VRNLVKVCAFALALTCTTTSVSAATIYTPAPNTVVTITGGIKINAGGFPLADCTVSLSGITDLTGVTITGGVTNPRNGSTGCNNLLQFPFRMDVTQWVATSSKVLFPYIRVNTPLGFCTATNVSFNWSNLYSFARNFSFPIPPYCSGEFEIYTSPSIYVQ